MELVTQNTELIVGKFYKVKCAELKLHYSNKMVIHFIPIIGEEHRDPQLGVKVKHYHIDGRFNNSLSWFFNMENGRTSTVIPTESENKKKFATYLEFVKVVEKKKRCVRLTTGLPLFKLPGIIYKQWYKDYVGKSCKGKKCPHLGHKMNIVNGRLECPLHGLLGDIEKEVIIPK